MGSSLLDLDFLTTSASVSANSPADPVSATMAQLGMADMLASLDSLAVPSPIAHTPGMNAISAWLDSLPQFAYVFSDAISLPVVQ